MMECKSKVEMGVRDSSQSILGKFKKIEVYFFFNNVKPGQRIPLSDLFTTEGDGMDPEDQEEMDAMDNLVEESLKLVGNKKLDLEGHVAGAKSNRVLTNLKLSVQNDGNEFLNNITFSGPENLQNSLKIEF